MRPMQTSAAPPGSGTLPGDRARETAPSMPKTIVPSTAVPPALDPDAKIALVSGLTSQ